MKEPDKCLDSQLWHACAGGMVQMPPVNSRVYYFPQGHAEHAQGTVNFGLSPRIPAFRLCRVAAVKFMADPDTDEVFAKIQLIPVRFEEQYLDEDDGVANDMDVPDKLASFAKTLTQSDANNGGGFSVPRYCAETIFPRLDYSADPPVQTVLAKDVHGEVWKFRHIYRGTPRRHLLTTGWSTFVNQKKLVAGDSVVFLRADNGDLCIGIRRAKRGLSGALESQSGWNHPMGNCLVPFGGFSMFLREDEKKTARNDGKGRTKAESVLEAANCMADGRAFEVVYYPRASTPEFCVKAASARAAMRIQWCCGMRFKMAFETEDSSRISWFMGTVSAVQVADPVRWPNSPWRLLQVSWDEPDLLQNVKRVSPWLVELVSNMPTIHLSPFSPQRKKLRLTQGPDFGLDGQLSPPLFSRNPLGPSSSPTCFLSESTPAGIQGARHAQYGISLSDLHLDKLQAGLFPAGFHCRTPGSRISTGLLIGSPSIRENVSCLLSIGNASHNRNKSCDTQLPKFVLFGKPILTEKEILRSSSRDAVSLVSGGNSSSDGFGSSVGRIGHTINLNSRFPWWQDSKMGELGSETCHCKVFMDSEDVGRTLDLSVLSSYDELHRKLADMFGIEKSNLGSNVLYRDSAGAVKHTGDEPFGDFTKTARRLTILMESGSDNIGG